MDEKWVVTKKKAFAEEDEAYGPFDDEGEAKNVMERLFDLAEDEAYGASSEFVVPESVRSYVGKRAAFVAWECACPKGKVRIVELHVKKTTPMG